MCESLKTGKEGQNACQKNSDRDQRAAEHLMQWVKKQRSGLLNRDSFERKSSSIKAKGRQSRSTGFARDFGWIIAGTKPSGRTLDLYIYIYIANDKSPSQHITVGLAKARPNKKRKKYEKRTLTSEFLSLGNSTCILPLDFSTRHAPVYMYTD